MSNSNLVNYIKLSPFCNKPRNAKIDKITIHHMAGNLSVETCGNVFQTSESSANYGIDSNGNVGMYVEEANRSWASSSRSNDNRAVTIEVANCGGAPDWKVSDKAFAKLIDLCVDICKRNGIKQLNYTGDANGNLTRHNMFAATTCPGPYLQGKFSEIAAKVNEKLGVKTAPTVKVLALNDTGAEVKKLQDQLNILGYKLSTDGIFGGNTLKAVKDFQKSRGLDPDGVVGTQTYAELDEALAELKAKQSYTQKQFIEDVQRCLGAGVDGIAGPITLGCTITLSHKKNKKHPVVKYVQKRLYALGYTEVGKADGIFGSLTRKAVIKFQKSIGGIADGEITAKQITWKRLLGM